MNYLFISRHKIGYALAKFPLWTWGIYSSRTVRFNSSRRFDLLKKSFCPFLWLLSLLRNFPGVRPSRDLIGQFRLSVICFSLNYYNGTFWQRTNCNLGLAILWQEESLRIPVQHTDDVVFPLNLPSRPSSSTGRRKYGFVED